MVRFWATRPETPCRRALPRGRWRRWRRHHREELREFRHVVGLHPAVLTGGPHMGLARELPRSGHAAEIGLGERSPRLAVLGDVPDMFDRRRRGGHGRLMRLLVRLMLRLAQGPAGA